MLVDMKSTADIAAGRFKFIIGPPVAIKSAGSDSITATSSDNAPEEQQLAQY